MPFVEQLRAFQELIDEGKVCFSFCAGSNNCNNITADLPVKGIK